MAKKRVYELARDLGFESKDVLERAQSLGIDVKTASSGLEPDAVELVTLSYEEETASDVPAPAPEPVAEPTPVVEEEPQPEPAPEPKPEPQPEPAEPMAEPAPVSGEDERMIMVTPGITVAEFATEVGERTGTVVKELMGMGEMVPGGGTIPEHALVSLGEIFGFEVLVDEKPEREEDTGPEHHMVEYEDDPTSLVPRPPVVTVMGHVDHGKTQLLDTIRKANVIAGEAGGITQHIGAYQVERNGSKITFLDTPGHEAFTALRARGANVTDIAIIVVAANDGVMPQTAEAIAHAKAANVPIIIAINKMDLPTADPNNVRAALTQQGIVVEALGGDTVAAEISALTGEGVDDLLEMVSLVAEVEELKANPNAPAVGTVIESRLEVGRGPVATVIVQRGTLKQGDAIVAGGVPGRVRAMFDDQENKLKKAGPSTPVLIMGWDDIPTAGDMFEAVKNDRVARKLAQERLDDIALGDLQRADSHRTPRAPAGEPPHRRPRRVAHHRPSRRHGLSRGDP